MSVVEARFTVGGELGLHARPAGRFVNLAGRFESEISVSRADNDEWVSGRSMLSILSLAARRVARLVLVFLSCLMTGWPRTSLAVGLPCCCTEQHTIVREIRVVLDFNRVSYRGVCGQAKTRNNTPYTHQLRHKEPLRSPGWDHGRSEAEIS